MQVTMCARDDGGKPRGIWFKQREKKTKCRQGSPEVSMPADQMNAKQKMRKKNDPITQRERDERCPARLRETGEWSPAMMSRVWRSWTLGLLGPSPSTGLWQRLADAQEDLVVMEALGIRTNCSRRVGGWVPRTDESTMKRQWDVGKRFPEWTLEPAPRLFGVDNAG